MKSFIHTGSALFCIPVVSLGLLLIGGCSPPPREVEEPAADLPRLAISLNGEWEVEQGNQTAEPPAEFGHTAPVPALLSAAEPRFEQIGLESELREAFWYRKEFTAPADYDRATLIIHKAKYAETEAMGAMMTRFRGGLR